MLLWCEGSGAWLAAELVQCVDVQKILGLQPAECRTSCLAMSCISFDSGAILLMHAGRNSELLSMGGWILRSHLFIHWNTRQT